MLLLFGIGCYLLLSYCWLLIASYLCIIVGYLLLAMCVFVFVMF